MDHIKHVVLTQKAIRLLCLNQYTFDVLLSATKTDVKRWVEAFFGIQVIAINSHRQPRKRRRRGMMVGHSVRLKRMIVTVRAGDSIPLS
jgi:large subunit ribosomal protein L23